MNRLINRYLRRRRTKGYGVQSPFAYRFVRYVIAERLPFYAYSSLAEKYPLLSKDERSRAEFLLRLSNFVKAIHWGIYSDGKAYPDYLSAGCKSSLMTNLCNAEKTSRVADCDALVLSLDKEYWENVYHAFLNNQEIKKVLFVDHIDADSHAWQRLCNNPQSTVCFDMETCGVIFFTKAVPKHVYLVTL